ncbi:MAG: MBL fold metallo-hydrolase [Clostridia bacterium]|nr:MBL fold metallo-hydrolase [Clostridia bacterium]
MAKIIRYDSHGLGSNCYLFSDDNKTASVVIDPSAAPETVAPVFGPILKSVRAILLTHAHADHMLALKKWKAATGAPILVGKYDRYALSDPEANVSSLLGLQSGDFGNADRSLEDGEEIAVGSEKLTVLHTPGHTPGSLCFLSSDALFSGDTLFALGGVGRTDFFGGSEDAIEDSISELLALSPSLRVYPGHGPETTIGRERNYHRYRNP